MDQTFARVSAEAFTASIPRSATFRVMNGYTLRLSSALATRPLAATAVPYRSDRRDLDQRVATHAVNGAVPSLRGEYAFG